MEVPIFGLLGIAFRLDFFGDVDVGLRYFYSSPKIIKFAIYTEYCYEVCSYFCRGANHDGGRVL